jgi:hypothetical protein
MFIPNRQSTECYGCIHVKHCYYSRFASLSTSFVKRCTCKDCILKVNCSHNCTIRIKYLTKFYHLYYDSITETGKRHGHVKEIERTS